MSTISLARDFAVFNEPILKGKFVSSLIYGHLKTTEDFDNRGEVDFKSHAAGTRFGFGITDRTSIAFQGGLYVNPEMEAQNSRWLGRSGFFYGLDLYNEIFPATEFWPGLQGQLGVLGFQVPLERLESAGSTILINQNAHGVEYHGALLGVWKVARFSPYLGLRAFGSSVKWRNNEFSSTGLVRISGKAKGNVSVVAGSSVQILKELRLVVEGRFVNETAISAGIQTSVF